MVAPFLSEGTAERIRGLSLRGFATQKQVRGTTTVVLSRWNDDLGRHVPLPPQDVLMAYANRAEEEARGGASTATLVDGFFEKEAPFSVAVGDLFSLDTGDGERLRGRIAVVFPAQMGIERAGWNVLIDGAGA